MSQTDYQITKDTTIDEGYPAQNYGIENLRWGHRQSNKVDASYYRTLFSVSFAALAADQIIKSAQLIVEVFSITGTPGPVQVHTMLIADNDWVEAEADWEEKSNGVAWAQGGGGSQQLPASGDVSAPGATGTWTIDVSGLAAYAQKNNSELFDVVGRGGTGVGELTEINIYSREDANNEPFLRIIHETHGRQVFM